MAVKTLDRVSETSPVSSNRKPLAALAALGETDIETGLAASLSADLHALFDRVSDGVLPIYFGPLLGRLYLEGL